MLDPDRGGDASRVVQIVEGAAASEAVSRRLALVVQLHRHADDLVALFVKKRGRDRGIDSSRHGNDDAHDC
jgi:hypothetical protein